MFGDQISMFESLQLTVIAMSIVFAILYAISLLLHGFEFLFPDKAKDLPKQKSAPKSASAPVVAQVPRMNVAELTNDEEKMIVAFVASIEATGSNKDTNYRVVSVKQL